MIHKVCVDTISLVVVAVEKQRDEIVDSHRPDTIVSLVLDCRSKDKDVGIICFQRLDAVLSIGINGFQAGNDHVFGMVLYQNALVKVLIAMARDVKDEAKLAMTFPLGDED